MALHGIGPIGPARFGFDHDASDFGQGEEQNSIRTEGMRRDVVRFFEVETSCLMAGENRSGDESASDPDAALSGLLLPDGFQIDAHGRENGHM